MGGEFDFSKGQIPSNPGRGIVGLNIDGRIRVSDYKMKPYFPFNRQVVLW